MDLHRQSACRDGKRLLTTLAWEVAAAKNPQLTDLACRDDTCREKKDEVWAGRVGIMHHYWLVKESFVLLCNLVEEMKGEDGGGGEWMKVRQSVIVTIPRGSNFKGNGEDHLPYC